MFGFFTRLRNSFRGHEKRVIAGSDHYSKIVGVDQPGPQELLYRLCGKYTRTSHNRPVDVILKHEEGTKISVWIGAYHMGYIENHRASKLAPVMNGARWLVEARITGGRWINMHVAPEFRLLLLFNWSKEGIRFQ